MIRQIIKIDENLCNGCGLCADACKEGAIAIINGKATLMRDDYCDGFGNCLPVCPTGAISFEEREAADFDEEAVKTAQIKKIADRLTASDGCPGSRTQRINHAPTATVNVESCLSQWPVQIKLISANAPYFNGADILVAADCTAYAYANFHKDFIDGRITLIGCPKLDDVDYSQKLTDIVKCNDIKSITVTRMEVPCCGGIDRAVKNAVAASGKDVPVNVIIIGTDGRIL